MGVGVKGVLGAVGTAGYEVVDERGVEGGASLTNVVVVDEGGAAKAAAAADESLEVDAMFWLAPA